MAYSRKIATPATASVPRPAFASSGSYGPYGFNPGATSTSTVSPFAGASLFGSASAASSATPATGSLFGGASTATSTPAATGVPFGNTSTANASTLAHPSTLSSTINSRFGTTTPSSATTATTLTNTAATPSTPLSKQAPSRDFTKSVSVRFGWQPSALALAGAIWRTYGAAKEEDYCFQICLQESDGILIFQLQCTPDEIKKLNWVSSVFITSADKRLRQQAPVFWSLNTAHIGSIHPSRLPGTGDLIEMDISLTSETAVFGLADMPQQTNHCETIMGKMLSDFTSYDVYFDFDPRAPAVSNVKGMDAASEKVSDKAGEAISGMASEVPKNEDKGKAVAQDNGKSVKDKEKATDNSDGKDNVKAAEDKNTGQGEGTENNGTGSAVAAKPISSSESAVAFKPVADANKVPFFGRPVGELLLQRPVGAHKLVLNQFKYFRTMFSSSFAEGGPGVKRIRIKDVDPKVFELMIQFMYLGHITFYALPSTLTRDMAAENSPSWEDVYLIADRYSVHDLRQLASNRILAGLNKSWALPFLFRTGYLFDDLRSALIKFVVRSCMPEIVSKSIQESFFDHPECSSIFGDIISELWSNQTKAAPAKTSS